jgi:hypothetical protein
MSQRVDKLSGFVIEGIFAGSENYFDVLGFFVDLVNEKRVDDVLGNVFLLVSIVHKPWKVAVHFSFVVGFMRNGSIRSHFATDGDLFDSAVGRRSKVNYHVTSFGHFGVDFFVFFEEMNERSFS